MSSADAQPRRTLSQIEHDRSAAQRQAQRLRAQAGRTRAEIDALNQRLMDAGRRRRESEAAAQAASQRLEDLRARAADAQTRYRRDRDALDAAIITAALAQRGFEPAAARTGIQASAVTASLANRLQQIARDLEEINRLDASVREEQSVLVSAQAAIDAERAGTVTLLAQRRTLQNSLLTQAAAADTRAQRLASEARSLRELAQRVQVQRDASAQGRAAIIPASWLAPADGRILSGFGTRTAAGPPSQGATLRTRALASVRAPSSGVVAYAGAFRNYGQVVILNLDGAFTIVLAGLGTTRVRVGETVARGQAVGEMPNSAASAPDLYVEVRSSDRPIDPGRWLGARAVAEQSDERAG